MFFYCHQHPGLGVVVVFENRQPITQLNKGTGVDVRTIVWLYSSDGTEGE